MIRIIIIAFMLFAAHAATAQRLSTWEALVEHPDPDVSPKPAFAGIMEGLPGSDLQFVRKTWTFVIVTDQEFEIPWLEGVLGDAGFTLTGLLLEGLDLTADPEEESPAEQFEPAPGSMLAQPMNGTPHE